MTPRPLPPSATRAASALTAYANAVGCPLGGPGLKPADLTVPPHRRGGHHDRRMAQAPILCPPGVVLRPVVTPDARPGVPELSAFVQARRKRGTR